MVGIPSDIRIDNSIRMNFKSDEIYYRGVLRVDGQPERNERNLSTILRHWGLAFSVQPSLTGTHS